MWSKAEHMAWAKDRARTYLEANDAKQAISSLTSDLLKHDETQEAARVAARVGMAFNEGIGTFEHVRVFIEELR